MDGNLPSPSADLVRGSGQANGWRVVGKVAAVAALPLLVQAGGAVWWAASAESRIAANAREADANRQDIRAALTALQSRMVDDGRRDQRLDDLARQMAEIRRSLERIEDRLAPRPERAGGRSRGSPDASGSGPLRGRAGDRP